jgi:UDP-2-acetamido-3-amino-2,3-dideoxy-glucuronate N-acetyltransferase
MGGQVGPHVQIDSSVELGEDVRIFGFANLYGCRIGDRTKVGTFVEIQRNASVGADCKISSHSFICEGVRIGNRVFVGHNVTFINDLYPRATNPDGSLQTAEDWEMIETHVEDGASLGSSVTVLAGIRIGAGAIIGAGSVVTKNVGPGEIWAGNPARFRRKVDA